MTRLIAVSALTLAMLASNSWAEDSDFGYAAIAAKDWVKAETQLRQELDAAPGDPMRLVNLAFVLQQQGRNTEATQVYQQVLEAKSNPKVAIGADGDSKAVRVKAIASRGLEAIEETSR